MSLMSYKLFESKKKEKEKKKIKEKIKKFYDNDFVIDNVLKLHPKLAVWMINQLIKKTKEDYKPILNDKVKDKLKFKSATTNKWRELKDKFVSIVDWSKSKDITPQERQELTKLTFDEAFQKSDDWHNSLEAGGVIENETGEIIMEFDDGFYWIDLGTTYCEEEADAMGHCANTNEADTLFSLRDRKKQPHVTVAFETYDKLIYQMKGKNNKKPIAKYHPYIVDLLINPKLEINGFDKEGEYRSDLDFNVDDLNAELREKLEEGNKKIFLPYWKDSELDDLYKGYLETYYGQDEEHGFVLVNWVYEIFTENGGKIYDGLKEVISCMDTSDDNLLEILKKEFPESIDDEKEIEKFEVLKIVSRYLNPDKIAKKYNISIQGDSPSNRWYDLSNKLEMRELIDILLENNLLEHFEEEFGEVDKNDFDDGIFRYIVEDFEDFDIEELLDHFIGFGEWKKHWDFLVKTFNKDWDEPTEYADLVFDVWESWALIDKIVDNTPAEKMRSDMEANDYYEYTGQMDW